MFENLAQPSKKRLQIPIHFCHKFAFRISRINNQSSTNIHIRISVSNEAPSSRSMMRCRPGRPTRLFNTPAVDGPKWLPSPGLIRRLGRKRSDFNETNTNLPIFLPVQPPLSIKSPIYCPISVAPAEYYFCSTQYPPEDNDSRSIRNRTQP